MRCGRSAAQRASTWWPRARRARTPWYSEPAAPESGSSGTSAAERMRRRSLAIARLLEDQERLGDGGPDAWARGPLTQRFEQVATCPRVAALEQAAADEVGDGAS